MIHAMLLQLLLTFPSGPHQDCIRSRAPQIERQAARAVRRHRSVPPEMLIAVGFQETHLGCVRGIGWGARLRRSDRGNPAMAAARSLERGLRVCENRSGALRFFRTGKCRESDVGSPYASRVLALASRIARASTRDRVASRAPLRRR